MRSVSRLFVPFINAEGYLETIFLINWCFHVGNFLTRLFNAKPVMKKHVFLFFPTIVTNTAKRFVRVLLLVCDIR